MKDQQTRSVDLFFIYIMLKICYNNYRYPSSKISFWTIYFFLKLFNRNFSLSLSAFCKGCLDFHLQGLPYFPAIALRPCIVQYFRCFFEFEITGDKGVFAVDANSSIFVIKLDKGWGRERKRGLLIEDKSYDSEITWLWFYLAVLLQYFLSEREVTL